MCVIAYKPANKPMFSKENIEAMFRRNPDGAGIMYVKGDLVHIEKGFFILDDLQKYLDDNENLLRDIEVVLHFRIATSGKLDSLNCHPFPLFTGNGKIVDAEIGLAHNGILDSYGWKGNEVSNDTQTFVKDLNTLPKNFIENDLICNLIEKSIGSNKLALMSKNGVKLIGKFINYNGYFYSNLAHDLSTAFYKYETSKIPSKIENSTSIKFNEVLSVDDYVKEVAKAINCSEKSSLKVKDTGQIYVNKDAWFYFKDDTRTIKAIKVDGVEIEKLSIMINMFLSGKYKRYLKSYRNDFMNIFKIAQRLTEVDEDNEWIEIQYNNFIYTLDKHSYSISKREKTN